MIRDFVGPFFSEEKIVSVKFIPTRFLILARVPCMSDLVEGGTYGAARNAYAVKRSG